MDFETFKNTLATDVVAAIKEKGAEVTVAFKDVERCNGGYAGMQIISSDSKISPVINIDSLFAFSVSEGYQAALDKVIKIAEDGLNKATSFDTDSIVDYSVAKNKLFIATISIKGNEELLATVPHEIVEDLAIVYRVCAASDHSGIASVLITNSLLNVYGITHEQLHEDAMASTVNVMPATVKSLDDVISEMVLNSDEPIPRTPFILVGNTKQIHGASAIFYPGVLDILAKIVDGSFFILPSSIHEVLILSDYSVSSIDELKDMVQNVNANEVAPADKLSDNVYHYDSEAKCFEAVDNFVKRQETAA